jgi:FKBP-type peptidyl-prolyl cis-trans isomerase SlyD
MNRTWNLKKGWSFVILFGIGATAAVAAEPSKPTIMEGNVVSLEYTLRLDEKTVVESNVGKEPLTYRQGMHELVAGLEKQLAGMAVGERKQVSVKPEDGYGVVDPSAFKTVQKKLIPPDALKVGAQLRAQAANGQQLFPRVAEIKDDTVVLDFNHPLAGKTLYFDVKVLDITQAATNK